jgi:hypothetical protein
MRLLLILTLFATPTIASETSAATPTDCAFSPLSFFHGRTEGRGTLTKIMSRSSPVTVLGQGRMVNSATLILDQTITRPGSQPKQREWRLVETSPGHFRGTLTDAVGPVTGVVTGNDFHVRYRINGAVQVDQHLVLQPGGLVIVNHMVFRKLGIRVARMTETIRKTE